MLKIALYFQARPKALPATQNASQKSSGDKNKEVGAKFKFGQLILRKIIKIDCCHQMSYFKAKMHRIRFRSPDLLTGFKDSYF